MLIKIKNKIFDSVEKYLKLKAYRKNSRWFYGKYVLGGIPFHLRVVTYLLKFKELCSYISHIFPRKIGTSDSKGKLTVEQENTHLKTLKENGILIISEYFSSEEIDHITSHLEHDISEPKKSATYGRIEFRNIDRKILSEVLLEPSLLRIISKFYQSQPFLRHSSSVSVTYPDFDDITSRDYYEKDKYDSEVNFANNWHCDTPYLFQCYVLLNDVDLQSPHMLFAKKSIHRPFGLNNYNASEEYVRDNFELEHCIGKKGTIYLFNGGSGLHRLFTKKDGFRLTLETYFTKGNSILDGYLPIKFENPDTVKNLDELQRRSLSSLKI